MKRIVNKYGWVPDFPDHRDYVYAAPRKVVAKLPTKVDLRKKCPPVYDQGRIGSCTANAIGAAMQFVRRIEKRKPDFVPSRLFIYWNERNMEHTVPVDNGARFETGSRWSPSWASVRRQCGPIMIHLPIQTTAFGRRARCLRSSRRRGAIWLRERIRLLPTSALQRTCLK